MPTEQQKRKQPVKQQIGIDSIDSETASSKPNIDGIDLHARSTSTSAPSTLLRQPEGAVTICAYRDASEFGTPGPARPAARLLPVSGLGCR